MSTTGHPRSRMFKVSASLLLSTAYFVAALGVWMVQQGRINSSADSINATCEPPHQQTDTFNAGNRVDGGEISLPAGWTKDSGTVLYGNDRNISNSDSSDAWASINGRIQRPIAETRQGQIDFRLSRTYGYGSFTASEADPIEISLLTKTGSPLSLLIDVSWPATGGAGTQGTVRYRDPLSGEYKPAEYEAPLVTGFGTTYFPYAVGTTVGKENTFSYEMRFTVKWDGTNFFLDSPYATGLGGSSKSKTYRYAQNGAASITAVALTGRPVNSNFVQSRMNLDVQQVVYPAGTSTPCLTSASPNPANAGAVVTLTGINFTGNGNTKVHIGSDSTVDLGNVNSGGTEGQFTLPASLTPRETTLKVTNELGESGTIPFTISQPAQATFSVSGTVWNDANGDGEKQPTEQPLADRSITLMGNGIVGGVSCTTNSQQTDTFEAAADGATKNFDWQITSFNQTSGTVKADRGKIGKGLVLSDTNSDTGATLDHDIYAARLFQTADQGSVSLDVRPEQTNAIVAINLRNHNASSNGTNFIYVYFYNDGTIRYFKPDAAHPLSDDQYIQLGSATYRANEWYRVKIDWTTTGFDVFLNDAKLTTTPIVYPSTDATELKPATSLLVYTQNSVGTVAIDNVEHPDCTAPVVTGRTATTDAQGAYTFDGLTAGIYRVAFLAPGGYASTTNRLVESKLGPNATHHFGAKQLPPQAGFVIRGTVFEDKNTNGNLDSTDRKIPGQTVQLIKNSTAISSVSTDANGGYAFAPMAAGAYTVKTPLPTGFSGSPSDSAAVTLTDADKTVNIGMKQSSGGGGGGGGGSGGGNSPTEAAKKAVTALVSSGGSLGVNLGLAALLSLGTTYALLRRKSVASSQ